MKRQQNEKERVKNLMISQNIFENCDDGMQDDTEAIFKHKRFHRKSMFQGCNINIPGDILTNKNSVASMTRMSITHTQACAFLETLISECGGNPRDIHLSVNYSFRHCEKTIHDASTSIKENFEGKFPLGLHWDCKIMNDIEDTNVKIERLAVIVSDLEGNTKLLGAPKVPIGAEPGTAGKHIAEAAINLLKEWKIQDLVATMIFDTTPTNTGVDTGACKMVQELFERPLLFCACRKHIGEVHIGHCFDCLNIEASKGPEISVYNTFKNNFHLIPVETTPKKTFNINNINLQHREFFVNQKAIIIATFNELKAKDVDLRDDYKELMNLVLMYIGENDNYIIHKPGATHKARWLMKLLHSIKIVLLEDGIPKDIFGKGRSGAAKMDKMKRFVRFFVFCYIPWWYMCPIATSAARNDIQFYQNVCYFQNIDEVISKTVVESIMRHKWYIVPEMIPLALFDEGLDFYKKDILAKRILTFPRNDSYEARGGNRLGKPKFTKHMPSEVGNATLTADVWNFFDILHISEEFLKTPSNTWDNNPSYIDGLQKATHLKVCNDAAERGVKMIKDFSLQAKGEIKMQEILQVVEENRSVFPNLRKRCGK